ncbi:hypothetical protein M422DRAFT_147160, partial [Sphaerobolus stellatus SS14]
LRRHLLGVKPRHEAHTKQQMLTAEQADVLIDWSIFLGSIAQPCTCTEIKAKIFSMVGRVPSDDWVRKFLRRQPKIVAHSGKGLDP